MLLRGNNITSGYGGPPIVSDIDIEVSENQLVAIIGPNGAGKSTLLKTLFGFLEPYSGTIRLADKDITDVSAEKMVNHGAAYVFQRENIFREMRVKENLEMAVYTKPSLYSEQKEKIFDLFPVLENKLDSKAKLLSGGEQQMLAIACGLMLEPQVLFVDEPSATLAPDLVEMVFDRLNDVNETGTTMIIVEQNVNEVLRVADQVYILENGENRYSGTPTDLQENEELSELYI